MGKHYFSIVNIYVFPVFFSVIYSLKISKSSGYLNLIKGYEDKFGNKSQNSEYPTHQSLHNNQPFENDLTIGNNELMESDYLIEKISKDEALHKRHINDHGFSREYKQQMLDLHNLYRSNVTPPAANMAFMEWDDYLGHLAQLWADRCVMAHGTPPGTEYPGGYYGQNLYLGAEPTGYEAAYMWYEEFKHYNLKTHYCKPFEKCGHYVQIKIKSQCGLITILLLYSG
ncbi:peptidase inhibitor 16 [Trichonephila clavata]|uniref:Peptidase inhibitor 16 n=1 Tax=Trichonephila clavata TaxID=2740835 RepID=A0A8X6FYS3_TRICU|nr:peptidase inhibitor 16 [Trichonephila clavata]